MKITNSRNFYLFRGHWLEFFDKLAESAWKEPSRFSIWESKSRNRDKEHLLIIYGGEIKPIWKHQFDMREINEPEFHANYRVKIQEHRIHGYNEFRGGK